MQEMTSAKQSIRSRVVLLISGLITVAMLLMTVIVVYVVEKQITEQTYALLKSQAHDLHLRMEQQIRHLVENSVMLTTNKLMINALTDSEGREEYLSALVENFSRGKRVLSVDVVDFDGQPIFQTSHDGPHQDRSSQLRAALAIGELSLHVRERDDQLVIVSPINYYNTTQGAVVIVFDLKSIAAYERPLDANSVIRLLVDGRVIYRSDDTSKERLNTFLHKAHGDMPFMKELRTDLEIGLPTSVYNKPIKKTFVLLLMIGIVFIALGLFFASVIANTITRPILRLYDRVKASSEADPVRCSPLGTDDELEELAKVFDRHTQRLQHLAEHDVLTRLPNRALFIDRLQQAIKSAKRNDERLAVVFFDLDRFKEVNDSFGHDFGDELLKQVAKNVTQGLRSSDTIARLGGDEFILLLEHITHEEIITNVIHKIMQLFKKPFTIKHHQFFISSSIGIAVYPMHGETADELIKNADAAMYRSKENGRNLYHFYSDDMTQIALQRVTLETQLRHAIVDEELEVYYQPQIDMRDGSIMGMEGLIRWVHPEKGLISPADFIPLAEETGVIVELDRWVMRDAMKQFVLWQEMGFAPGVLSLNLSIVQLNHEDFIDEVKATMHDSKILPSDVLFEITETQVMRNPERSIIMLQRLRELGVRLAIDDFGTGHSSLSYLKRLPIDKIKVDKSFVRDIPDDKDDIELTRAIIALSRSLRLEVIAEGVETTEQSAFLIENGCFEAQGYLFHRPQDVDKVTKLLRQVHSIG